VGDGDSARIVPNFSEVGEPNRVLIEDSSVSDSTPANCKLEGPALVPILDAVVGAVF